jgi:beta-lactamase superfamily II metal-dependent hydrolase
MRTFLAIALAAFAAFAQGPPGAVEIFLIDVEGGNATLFVSPTGHSMLMDTGNGGANAGRDAGRIMDAVRAAGLDRIDYLVTSHWHGDHFGAMEEIATRIPIGVYVDHGPSVESNPGTETFLSTVYPRLYEVGTRRVVAPGDTLDLGAARFTFLASAGEVIDSPLPGAGEPNPYCDSFTPQAEDTGENARSAGGLLSFGVFRALHLGDLTVNREFDLMCPANRVGAVDLFVVSHHGQPSSNDPVLVHAIRPRVAILNNGTRKGGQPEAMRILYTAPRLEDLWQLHFSWLSGQEYSVPGLFIANTTDGDDLLRPVEPGPGGRGAGPAPAHNGPAFWIRVSAFPDGSFSVLNARNGFRKTYPAP